MSTFEAERGSTYRPLPRAHVPPTNDAVNRPRKRPRQRLARVNQRRATTEHDGVEEVAVVHQREGRVTAVEGDLRAVVLKAARGRGDGPALAPELLGEGAG